ncbi:helix-turn-helix domain-containing protein [Streptomyces litchfieldiae]|uniref:XRE family transcriptional regulator n=1 Tax=Streptomyces litchfieldiae TaxID=3075543 RepID=A0ABU2MV81_9ACTN|nr:XRE family transcriptional regulator [Streptomyces sp. DSM 44938]MDT0344454.1 XRE family transcriptional regulator [Streptomyces sp. DSM 44938]
MADNFNAVLDAVGPRLRAIRKQRGSTLEQLAELTGMSVSTLSRIESGQRRPTLEVLLPLAQAYRMPLDELVGAPATGDPRIHPQPVHRDGVVWVPLSRDPGGLHVFKQVLPVPAQVPERLDQQVHEGYEWLYVLTGKLRLALGEKEFLLGAGEAAEFNTRVPHAIANAGRRPLELLIIFGQQGERIHLRARTK